MKRSSDAQGREHAEKRFLEEGTGAGAVVGNRRMSESKTTSSLRFSIGDLVQHELFDYRGVVVGVNPQFQGTDEWYETVARSRPPKDRPWYHVLPHGATHQTYVADQNLQPDHTGRPIEHPLVEVYFTHFIGGRYVSGRMN